MSQALVASSAAFATSSTTSVAAAFGQATAAGNCLIAQVGATGTSLGTITTTASGWQQAVVINTGTASAAIWYKPNCSASETAPTFTCTGATYMSCFLSEWSGMDTSAPLDKVGSTTAAPGVSVFGTYTATASAASTAANQAAVGATAMVCSKSCTVSPYNQALAPTSANGGTQVDNSATKQAGHSGGVTAIANANNFAEQYSVSGTTSTGTVSSLASVVATFLTGTASTPISDSDSAAGSESVGTLAAATTETAAGSDTASLVGTATHADTAAAAEAAKGAIGGADSSTGADSGKATPLATDTATAADSATATSTTSASDTAAGADVAVIRLSVSDTATATDSATAASPFVTTGFLLRQPTGGSYLRQASSPLAVLRGPLPAPGPTPVSAGDTAVGSELVVLTISASDTAAGAEATSLRTAATDTAAATDAAKAATTAADSSSGADAASTTASATTSDSATAAEATGLRTAASDTATAAETVGAGTSGSDPGSATDTAGLATIAADTSTGGETAAAGSTATASDTAAGTDTASGVGTAAASDNAVGSDAASTYTIAVMPPVSDVSAGGWTTNTGATTNLYAAIDEPTADDSDYIQSEPTPVNSPTVVALAAATDPGVSTGHVISYRYQMSGTGQIDLVVDLMQGGTVIASWTHTSIPASWVTASQTLSGAQADSITDYSNLRLRFTANQAG